MGGTDEIPIIVRGEGCYLEDSNGKRYLDALAGLFAVNIGYSFGDEIGQAAHDQMKELPYYTNWSYAHPARDRAGGGRRRARAGRPEPGLLLLGRLGGGGVGVEARAPALRRPQGAAAPVEGDREDVAYHGTTMGALSINGIPALRARSSRSSPTSPTSATRTATTGRRRSPRSSSPRCCSRTSRHDQGPRPRDGRDGDHGAGAERRRRPPPAATGAASGSSATGTTSSSAPTR